MARGKSNRREIWVADAETDPFKYQRIPAPFIWGLYNGDEYFEFTETEKLIEFVEDKKIVIYAHNGGKFDWHFITQYIADFEELTVISGRLAKFKIGECEFRDSFNIIPAPLSAYKKDEIDYALFEADKRDEHMDEIREYLKNDCIYLHEMVTNFIDTYGMHLTQAGAAMKTWSKMTDIQRPDTSSFYYDELKPYYYGGRTECFKKGEIFEPFSVVDINSAYPYAMTFEHPWGQQYSTWDNLDGLSDDDISRTLIRLNARASGAFPWRDKSGLNFPSNGDEYEFYVSGWEYLAARDTDSLWDAKVKSVCIFPETINFKEYVEHFFKLKDEAKKAGDAANYLFAKIFLNSLYGKFASNPDNYEEFMTLPADMIDAAKTVDGWTYCRLLDENTAVVNRPLLEEKHRYYDVAVAASITGFVRAYLWRNIYATNNTAIYCDTDSIAAHDVSKIEIGDLLGQWDVEAQCTYAAVAGKKLYAFRKENGEYKIASKGVRLNAGEIISIAQGNEFTHENDAPTFTIKGDTVFQRRKIRMLST